MNYGLINLNCKLINGLITVEKYVFIAKSLEGEGKTLISDKTDQIKTFKKSISRSSDYSLFR